MTPTPETPLPGHSLRDSVYRKAPRVRKPSTPFFPFLPTRKGFSMTKLIPPPPMLGDAGKALWREIAKQWRDDDLTPDARELRTLADACSEADTLAALETELRAAQKSGAMIVRGSQGQPVAHPFVSEARASRTAIRAALYKLGMEDPAAAEKVGKGGRTTSWQARAAAMERHRRAGA